MLDDTNEDDFMFDPIFDDLEIDNKDINEEVKHEVLPVKRELTLINEDTLNINNLLNITENHIVDDLRVRKEIENVTAILSYNKDKMSIKELIDYLKVLIKEREFHNKCISDAYNFTIKTEMAKKLIYSGKEKTVIDVIEKKKLNEIVRLLKNSK